MTLHAHGVSVELPAGWSGRVFSRVGGLATLHAATFPLALDDGEFGDRSTGLMPPGGSFFSLTEYGAGLGLRAGEGLFAPRRMPLPLDPTAFGPRRLAHHRPGQAGAQHFFTASGRPFCLYLVVAGGRADLAGRPPRREQLLALDRVLASIRIDGRG
jgi:hypothetical protein